MRILMILALCAVALPVAAAPPSKPKPPAPPVIAPPPPVMVMPRPPAPRTWDDIPAGVRARLERNLRPLSYQSVLTIEPIALTGEPQAAEAGTVLFKQWVSPARAVRLTSAPRRDYYGEIGSVLWQVRDGQDEYWCRTSTFNLSTGYNYYCYQDADRDGVFDALYEIITPQGYLGFQTFALGHDEKLKKPVSYVPADAPQGMREFVAVRYTGVRRGLIDANGFVRPGLVQFELIVGGNDPRTQGQRVIKTYDVELNAAGRASVELPSGYHVTIDQVEVGGRARIVVTGGMPAGEGYLLPAVTRDDLFKRFLKAIGAPPPAP